MIAMMVALLAAQPLPSPQKASDAEIVVTGRKMRLWTGRYEIRGALRKCQTKKSSGDLEVDHIGCAAFEVCADKYQALTSAGDAPDLDRKTRAGLKTSLIDHMKACVIEQRSSMIDDLVRKRADARGGAS